MTDQHEHYVVIISDPDRSLFDDEVAEVEVYHDKDMARDRFFAVRATGRGVFLGVATTPENAEVLV